MKSSFHYSGRKFITSQNQRSEIKTYQKPLMTFSKKVDFTHFLVAFPGIDYVYHRKVVSITSFLFQTNVNAFLR